MIEVFGLYTTVYILAEEEEKDEFDSVGCNLQWIKIYVYECAHTHTHTHTHNWSLGKKTELEKTIQELAVCG